jgi:hypothetical protein
VGKYGRPICSVSAANIGDIGLYLIQNGFSEYITHWGRHPYMDAYSRPRLPLIPDEACHPFHAKAATDSTAKLPPWQAA